MCLCSSSCCLRRDPLPFADGDGRALGDKGRARLLAQSLLVLLAIEACDITVECCRRGAPNPPLGMLDLVLQRRPVPLGDIAPVVLGDELFLRSHYRVTWDSLELRTEDVPVGVVPPDIL